MSVEKSGGIALKIANKHRNFFNSCSQAGPEKVSRRTPQASFGAFFAGGQMRSPVFNDPISGRVP